MKRFSRDSYARARSWLFTYGRKIDQARWLFHFEHGSADAVTEALATYHNADGGFGRALEPDVRRDESSVLATTVALQILREVGADDSHPLTQSAIGYLIEQLDRDTLAWMNVPANVDDAPHAPWWDSPEKPTTFTANPGGEIVDHFHHYTSLVPAELLAQLTDAAIAFVRPNADDLSMHDLFCCHGLSQISVLPSQMRDELFNLARKQFKRLVETNPAKWTTYCMRPLQAADSPDSPYMADFEEAVNVNLDYLIDTQQADGCWPPNWTWGDTQHPEAWEQSKRDWQGAIIVGHLRMLYAFDRLVNE